MANRKRRPCAKCGEPHQRIGDLCHACNPKPVAPARSCMICGEQIPREPGRGQSDYCSIACSDAVSAMRAKVSRLVARAVAHGDIPRALNFSCVDCGAPAVEYDHRHYTFPLDVAPVCRSCNLKRRAANDVRAAVAMHFGVPEIEVGKYAKARYAAARAKSYAIVRANLAAPEKAV